MTLDAGVLIAAERDDQKFWLYWEIIAGIPKAVPAPVLAQVWRGQQSIPLLTALVACRIEPLDADEAKRVGELCGRSRTTDIADASVMVSALRRGDDILTTDVRDIRRLTASVGFRGRIIDFDRLRLP